MAKKQIADKNKLYAIRRPQDKMASEIVMNVETDRAGFAGICYLTPSDRGQGRRTNAGRLRIHRRSGRWERPPGAVGIHRSHLRQFQERILQDRLRRGEIAGANPQHAGTAGLLPRELPGLHIGSRILLGYRPLPERAAVFILVSFAHSFRRGMTVFCYQRMREGGIRHDGSKDLLPIGTRTVAENNEFKLIKSNDDKRLVFGWANVVISVDGEQIVDYQNDVIDPEELERAAYRYVA